MCICSASAGKVSGANSRARKKYKPTIAAPCSHCGTWIEGSPAAMKGKRYCSKRCSHAARVTIPNATCKNCNREYKPRAKEYVTFCGRDCSYEYLSAHGRPERKNTRIIVSILKRKCQQCESRFTSLHGARYCSDDCRTEQARMAAKPQDRTRDCKQCGEQYTVPHDEYLTAFCSDDCKQDQLRHQRSKHKARRRALERTTRVDSIGWVEIAERDGYQCNACKCETPRKLRGTCEDSAPELDHVHPLSKGGSHTADNLQILCRLCNQMKSDKPMSVYMREVGLSTP